ncbi:MAG: succinate dehydrogenase assembly factor 2 [Betaproteobacteria bacterium]|jgi:Uncharacterized conserved protein|nr:succinate dehydrogenase assembly factor 2 [Betaproteobacteria bacterium]
MEGAYERDDRWLERLRWRCRRGMLETDVLLQRFLVRHLDGLSIGDQDILAQLLELDDNTLLDYLLGRRPAPLNWGGLLGRMGE